MRWWWRGVNNLNGLFVVTNLFPPPPPFDLLVLARLGLLFFGLLFLEKLLNSSSSSSSSKSSSARLMLASSLTSLASSTFLACIAFKLTSIRIPSCHHISAVVLVPDGIHTCLLLFLKSIFCKDPRIDLNCRNVFL